MRKKPSIAGLKRELAEAGLELMERRQEMLSMSRELQQLHEKIKDLEDDVNSDERRIGWHERQNEQNMAWFEESLRLLAPHLVPDKYTGCIDIEGINPIDRLLIEMHRRLSRRYDKNGAMLYETLQEARR